MYEIYSLRGDLMKEFLKFLLRIPLVIILAPIVFCLVAAAWMLISVAMAVGGVYILYEFLIYGESRIDKGYSFEKKENENENKDNSNSDDVKSIDDKLQNN